MAPDAETLTGQAEQKIDDQAAKVLTGLEQDAIAFIQAAAKHAEEAIPLLTGELGTRLSNLLQHAKDLAAKHGFTL